MCVCITCIERGPKMEKNFLRRHNGLAEIIYLILSPTVHQLLRRITEAAARRKGYIFAEPASLRVNRVEKDWLAGTRDSL